MSHFAPDRILPHAGELGVPSEAERGPRLRRQDRQPRRQHRRRRDEAGGEGRGGEAGTQFNKLKTQ